MSETLGNPVLERGRGRFRAFRPLLVWFCLLLLVVGRDVYRRVSAGTVIYFTVGVEGEQAATPVVTLDEAPFKSGHSVSIGKRTLSVSAPGFEPVQGESKKCASLAANAAPISLLTAGEMVLQSATKDEAGPKPPTTSASKFASA